MDRLEKILGDLMGVEYDVNALRVVLKALEAHYLKDITLSRG